MQAAANGALRRATAPERAIGSATLRAVKIPLLSLLILVAGCATAPVVTHRAAAPSGPTPLDLKLAEHRALQAELRAGEERVQAAGDTYEQKKGAYLMALATELPSSRGVKQPLVKTIATMASERTAVGVELTASLKMVGDALIERARSEETMLAVEGKLWKVEADAWGGRAQAAAQAQVEVRDLRDAVTALHVAQKAQQASLSSLVTREFEFTASIGDDVHLRDVADRQLAELRADLDDRYVRLMDAAQRFDAAADRIHRRLLKGLDPRLHEQAANQLRALLSDRDQAAAAVAAARGKLKEAVLKRAELRSQEISHDGEIAALLDSAFKDPASRDNFLIRVRDQRDDASAARVATQTAETAFDVTRRKLATVEGDINALGY